MESKYLQIINIAKKAGENFKLNRNFDIKIKSDISNIVTSMDVETQEYIIKQLKEVYPTAIFFAEENDVRELDNEYVFIIDPIDGTTNYAYDYNMSCVSIALLKNKEVIFGVVYNPYVDECYYAIKGEGSFLNDNPIHVNNDDLASSLVLFGSSPYNKELLDETLDKVKEVFRHSRDIRRSGSAAIDLCNVAAGKASCYFEEILSPWDYAAGALIVKEAGGICDTYKGENFTYEKRIPVYACNPNNKEEFLNIIDK
ncbi:MAG: inositol monophosphatase family protein [Erysipelotrichaceae bacterium]|nr:inositol monophosphatase family protein [Erysipelotrichaceae bacterium]